jgi:hypothetical protein
VSDAQQLTGQPTPANTRGFDWARSPQLSASKGEGPALPDSYWKDKKAPTQVTPGTRTIVDDKPSSRTPGTYKRTTSYDEYGRQTGQTHETDHGEPEVHPSPHHHTRDPATGETSGPLPGVLPEQK